MDRQPLLICEWTDPVTSAKGYFVIDTLIGGLCAGGIRMRPGVDLEEVKKLARTMTYKLAAIGSPFGGGKGGINYDPLVPSSGEVLKRFLDVHKAFVVDNWVTNEDLGTKEEDIIRILGELGVPTPFQAAVRKASDPAKVMNNVRKLGELRVDGLRMSDAITGFGVAEATLEAVQILGMPDRGTRVAIQGFGSVGGSAAKFLNRAGLNIVAIADAEGTIYSPDGLDVESLLTRRDRWGVVGRAGLPKNYALMSREDWLSLDVQVLIPAATADAITEANVAGIKARLIVEGANIPTTPGTESLLSEQGIVVIPDFVANAGAVGLATSILIDRVVPEVDECLAYISSQLRSTVRQTLDLCKSERITPRQAAVRIAEDKSRASV